MKRNAMIALMIIILLVSTIVNAGAEQRDDVEAISPHIVYTVYADKMIYGLADTMEDGSLYCARVSFRYANDMYFIIITPIKDAEFRIPLPHNAQNIKLELVGFRDVFAGWDFTVYDAIEFSDN